MERIEILAREVLNMRALQIEYQKLKRAQKCRLKGFDGEELARVCREMRDAELKVHEMCLDVVGIDEDIDYGTI